MKPTSSIKPPAYRPKLNAASVGSAGKSHHQKLPKRIGLIPILLSSDVGTAADVVSTLNRFKAPLGCLKALSVTNEKIKRKILPFIEHDFISFDTQKNAWQVNADKAPEDLEITPGVKNINLSDDSLSAHKNTKG